MALGSKPQGSVNSGRTNFFSKNVVRIIRVYVELAVIYILDVASQATVSKNID